ncbi:zinc finger MYM-type protein 1-like [Solenopsis invicta]|uniref:zinc finger MYM-type protein 1-like n=1 Tax=Solenopsis invicta TaxID=13686 RepID=UPI00193E2934|nr:zinc finger MYM-type protein 1-like [Solenopsis invicta]
MANPAFAGGLAIRGASNSSVSNSSSILPVDPNDNTETIIFYSDNDNGSKEQSTDPPLEPHVLEIGPSTSNTPNYIESNYTDDRINDNVQSAIPHISDSQLNEPSSDPALWELFRGSRNALQEYWIKNGFTKCQNFDIHADYKASVRNYESIEGNKKINRPRKLQNSYFYRELQNGEKVKREWVLYSPSQGKIFCFPCKLFNESDTSFTTGFNDWKHGLKSISDHENSSEHKTNLYTYIRRTKVVGRIDTELQLQLNEERNYWIEVFRRIVAVIKFLASRGLPFRGSNEIFGSNRNGNYLGMLELISEFDPFLREHIKKFGNSGRGKTSFLSSTICEKLIEIMGKKVFMGIIAEIRQAKYYSISIDSTPDVSHVDQLTFIIRYCKNGKSVERFLKFIPIYGHDAENLCEVVIKFLNENDISISNCRGQSYDNAANMARRYNGLQARINDINSLAFFIPCSAHSLNLVGVQAAESTEEVCKYFDFVQNLYTFFSASTHRWAVLIRALATLGPRQKVVKNLSDTRWSARADAVFALNNGYKPISFRNTHYC